MDLHCEHPLYESVVAFFYVVWNKTDIMLEPAP
jgi:hypothetical protein